MGVEGGAYEKTKEDLTLQPSFKIWQNSTSNEILNFKLPFLVQSRQ